MTYIMVDVETDGPIPGDFSMISLGAVVVAEDVSKRHTFFQQLTPISPKWEPEAIKISGISREDCFKKGADPGAVMALFGNWVQLVGGKKPLFISDNNGFDWQFVNWYFHHFHGKNPFGYSSTNLGSLYKGLVKDVFQNFKHLRKTKHTHNPVDDAMGNVEALIYMYQNMELKISL